MSNQINESKKNIYCCFSNDNINIETSIGLAFLDFVNRKKKEGNSYGN